MPTDPRQVGRYEILSRLGQGGMGVLYLARDPILRRTVAIKVMSVLSDELRERFTREARSAGSLTHPNIVTVYDVGEEDDHPFIAMEYVDGETLSEIIRRRAPLAMTRKLELALELCGGLGYAHRTGIIHRDIKPANLMITSQGVLKILDFGLARMSAESSTAGLTLSGLIMGTPNYMAPEQAEGGDVDHRSDIFSVGLVLYELLSYQKAFGGESIPAVLHKIVHGEPRPIVELCEGLDRDLDRIIGTAIQKAPAARYQDLSAMADALNRVLARTKAEEASPNVELNTSVWPQPAAPSDVRTVTPRHIPSPDAIERRRIAQVNAYLATARDALEAGDAAAAIDQCEMAIVLVPDDSRVLALLRRAHDRLEDGQVREWLAQAQAHLAKSDVTAARPLISQALKLRPDSAEALRLRAEMEHQRREQERVAERARATRAAIDRATNKFKDGALDAALRDLDEAQAYDPGNAAADELRRAVVQERDARLRREEIDRQAHEAVSEARDRADRGDLSGAMTLLRSFPAAHPLVNGSIAEIEKEQERASAKRAEEKRAEERRAAEARAAERREEERRAEARREEARREEARREEVRQAEARQEEARREEARRAEEKQKATPDADRRTRKKRLQEADPVLDVAPIDDVADETQLLEYAEPEAPPEDEPTAIATYVEDIGQHHAAAPAPPQVRRLSVPLVAGGAIVALLIVTTSVLVVRNRQDNSAAEPSIAPAASVPTTDSPAAAGDSNGTVVVDALPWAEVVRIVDSQGRDQPLPAERFTPLLLVLPPGAYELTLRNGTTRTVRATVRASAQATVEVADFGKIAADDYFDKLGLR